MPDRGYPFSMPLAMPRPASKGKPTEHAGPSGVDWSAYNRDHPELPPAPRADSDGPGGGKVGISAAIRKRRTEFGAPK